MHALADAAAGTECEVVANIDIGRSGGLGNGVVVVLVPLRIEAAGIWVPFGVRRDCVGVVDHSGAFGD